MGDLDERQEFQAYQAARGKKPNGLGSFIHLWRDRSGAIPIAHKNWPPIRCVD